jgi:hypothetical protein
MKPLTPKSGTMTPTKNAPFLVTKSPSMKPQLEPLTPKPGVTTPTKTVPFLKTKSPSMKPQIEPLTPKPEATNPSETVPFPLKPQIDQLTTKPEGISNNSKHPTLTYITRPETLKPDVESPTWKDKTDSPTLKPSKTTGNDSTPEPTPNPTFSPKPSVHPSAQPSYSLQVSRMIKNVVMVFDDCKWLESSSIYTWVNVTEKFVVSEIKTAEERQILYLDLHVFFHKQFVPVEQENNDTSAATSDAANNERYLQSSPLAIQFDQQFELRSPIENHPYQIYFVETLDTKEKQANYINELQTSGDPVFNSINSIKVLLDGRDISQQTVFMSMQQPSKVGPVAGIAVSIFVAAVVSIAIFIFRRKRAEKIFSSDEDSIYIDVPAHTTDMSTLGPPTGTFFTPSERYEDVTVGERSVDCICTFNELL